MTYRRLRCRAVATTFSLTYALLCYPGGAVTMEPLPSPTNPPPKVSPFITIKVPCVKTAKGTIGSISANKLAKETCSVTCDCTFTMNPFPSISCPPGTKHHTTQGPCDLLPKSFPLYFAYKTTNGCTDPAVVASATHMCTVKCTQWFKDSNWNVMCLP